MRLLERPALGVGSIEDGGIAEREIRVGAPLCDYLFRDPGRLIALIERPDGDHPVSERLGRSQRLAHPLGVGGDDDVGELQYAARGPIVVFEAHDGGAAGSRG